MFGFVFLFVECLCTPDENTIKSDRCKFIYVPNHMYVENLNQKATDNYLSNNIEMYECSGLG